jgi:hypothetical protein
VIAGATFSRDRRYRYRLWRRWDRSLPVVAFCMLNPSTADEKRDDPTIRRCIGFAHDWGYGGVEIVNLFAFRATDPRALRYAADPVGCHNDRHLARAARRATLVVTAWGAGADVRRARRAMRVLSGQRRSLAYLGFTRSRQPRHPLYLPRRLRPISYGSETEAR